MLVVKFEALLHLNQEEFTFWAYCEKVYSVNSWVFIQIDFTCPGSPGQLQEMSEAHKDPMVWGVSPMIFSSKKIEGGGRPFSFRLFRGDWAWSASADPALIVLGNFWEVTDCAYFSWMGEGWTMNCWAAISGRGGPHDILKGCKIFTQFVFPGGRLQTWVTTVGPSIIVICQQHSTQRLFK